MSGYSSFRVGKLGEDFVTKLLRNAGLPVRDNPAKTLSELSGWDLESELDGEAFRLEVKFDRMASKTGNIAIEYFNTRQGKPSGIGCTTAQLWVVVLHPFNAFIGRVADLRRFCTEVTPLRHISSGGDDNAALMLYRGDVLLPAVFHRLDDLTSDETTSLLRNLLCGPSDEHRLLDRVIQR